MSQVALPKSIDEMETLLSRGDYVADRSLSTVLFLALKMGRPILLEGEAGVGKTEIAKVLAKTLGRKLIRLQCYEGLDVSSAVYEWNYAAQMMAIRLTEAEGAVERSKLENDIFSQFLQVCQHNPHARKRRTKRSSRCSRTSRETQKSLQGLRTRQIGTRWSQ